MKKREFKHICHQVECGSELFVSHPLSRETGHVLRCSVNHFVVETGEGNNRCWDFHECGEINAREFPLFDKRSGSPAKN
jgi:hypothetical protein